MGTYLLFQEIMRAMNEKFTINPPVTVSLSLNIKKTGPYLLIITNYVTAHGFITKYTKFL